MITTEADIAALLQKEQANNGAILSWSHWGDRRYPDWNGFTTALVLRALRHIPISNTSLLPIREQALDFLLQCEQPEHFGSFRFWPVNRQPDWIKIPPSADADDTAIYALELARYGRLKQSELRRIACCILVPHRLRYVETPSPPWLRSGVFLTWLWLPKERINIVDCCVNANIVALLAYAGLTHLSGYQEACGMIETAILWAGNSWSHARSITPFYPHPIELCYAVEHAVECGADLLKPSLQRLYECTWAADESDNFSVMERPLCGSAYSGVFWTSSNVQIARTRMKMWSPIVSAISESQKANAF